VNTDQFVLMEDSLCDSCCTIFLRLCSGQISNFANYTKYSMYTNEIVAKKNKMQKILARGKWWDV